jgi:hypothetical protein
MVMHPLYCGSFTRGRLGLEVLDVVRRRVDAGAELVDVGALVRERGGQRLAIGEARGAQADLVAALLLGGGGVRRFVVEEVDLREVLDDHDVDITQVHTCGCGYFSHCLRGAR